MNFELRHLEAFVAVAEELHFGRAAARLHVAQPALSQQVLRLERALGVDLLVRERRRTALSPVGRAFLVEARATLAQARLAEAVARRAQRGETGVLRVGLAPSVALPTVLDRIAAFQERVPDVELDVRELPMDRLVPALRGDGVDLAFVALLVAPPTDRGVRHHELVREPLGVALPAGHPLAEHDRVPVAALRDERFAAFERDAGPLWHDTLTALCARAGFAPRVAHRVREVTTQLALVGAGRCVAFVAPSASGLGMRGVVLRPLAGAVPEIATAAAWREDDPSAVLARFRAVALAA